VSTRSSGKPPRYTQLVEWDGKLLPRALVEPQYNPPAKTCGWCGGLGRVPEQLDDDRLPVMAVCQSCQEYCPACGKWRKKGHACLEKRHDLP